MGLLRRAVPMALLGSRSRFLVLAYAALPGSTSQGLYTLLSLIALTKQSSTNGL